LIMLINQELDKSIKTLVLPKLLNNV
jgi:hypothetical protein